MQGILADDMGVGNKIKSCKKILTVFSPINAHVLLNAHLQ